MRRYLHKAHSLYKYRQETGRLRKIYDRFSNYTMIAQYVYLENLRLAYMIEQREGIVVECGVWRGGMIAGIASVLGRRREYHLFDSFEGLPAVKEIDGEAAKEWQEKKDRNYYDNCKAEMDFADKAMKMTGCAYTLHKGWFEDTLPSFGSNKPIALLRLDGDWYDSTMTCMENLFPLVIKDGVVIIDDYHAWDGCSRAIHDYLSRIKSASKINQSRFGVSFIIKKD